MEFSPAHKYTSSQRALFGRSERRSALGHGAAGRRSSGSAQHRAAVLATRLPSRSAGRAAPVLAVFHMGSRPAPLGGPARATDRGGGILQAPLARGRRRLPP